MDTDTEKEEKVNEINNMSKKEKILSKTVNLLSVGCATAIITVNTYFAYLFVKLYVDNIKTIKNYGWMFYDQIFYADMKQNLTNYSIGVTIVFLFTISLFFINKKSKVSTRVWKLILTLPIPLFLTYLLINLYYIIEHIIVYTVSLY